MTQSGSGCGSRYLLPDSFHTCRNWLRNVFLHRGFIFLQFVAQSHRSKGILWKRNRCHISFSNCPQTKCGSGEWRLLNPWQDAKLHICPCIPFHYLMKECLKDLSRAAGWKLYLSLPDREQHILAWLHTLSNLHWSSALIITWWGHDVFPILVAAQYRSSGCRHCVASINSRGDTSTSDYYQKGFSTLRLLVVFIFSIWPTLGG